MPFFLFIPIGVGAKFSRYPYGYPPLENCYPHGSTPRVGAKNIPPPLATPYTEGGAAQVC